MVEFRLYYDDKGKVLCYTCEDLEGNYIVIDAQTYAECRPDVLIIDGKIIKANAGAMIVKLAPSTQGIRCVSNDITIIADEGYTGHTVNWKYTQHGFKYN